MQQSGIRISALPEKMDKDKNNGKRSFGAVRMIILLIALIVFGYSAYQLYSIFSVYQKAGHEYSSLADDFTRPYSKDPADSETSGGPARTETSGEPVPPETSDRPAYKEGGAGLDGAARRDKNNERKNGGKKEAESIASGPENPETAETESGQTESASSGAEKPAEEKPAKSGAPEAPAEVFEDAEPPLEVDWDELAGINPDIVGWIYVDALPEISYPVLRGEDNDYYLHHTFRKEYLFAGSIFEDYHNEPDFSDPNTIVYGHNMRNGSMFNHLKKLNDQAKYDADPYFWILTPKGNYRYHIYCITTAGVNSDFYLLYKENDREFLEWEQKIQAASDVGNKVELTERDKTVVLSTCTSDSSLRVVVAGKCVSSERPVKITPVPTPIPEPDFPVIFDGIDELWADAFTGDTEDGVFGETYD